MGFFDKFLKGRAMAGLCSNLPFKPKMIQTTRFLARPFQVPDKLKTMRDIARENLAASKPASFDDFVRLNGGLPKRVPLNFKVLATTGSKSAVTFQSEPGLTIPGLLWQPPGAPKGAVVLVSENGKIAAEKEFGIPALLASGYACLAIDTPRHGRA